MISPQEGRAPPELEAFAERLERICLSPLARWYEAEGEDARRAAVAAFSPRGIQRALVALFDDVEAWYGRRHEEELRRAAGLRGVDPSAWLARPEQKGWVREQLRPRLDALLEAAIDVQTDARASLDFARRRLRSDGVLDELANAAGLLLRFWKIPAALRRQLASLRQASDLDARLRGAIAALEGAHARLAEGLEDAVVARWNERTVPLLERLESGEGPAEVSPGAQETSGPRRATIPPER